MFCHSISATNGSTTVNRNWRNLASQNHCMPWNTSLLAGLHTKKATLLAVAEKKPVGKMKRKMYHTIVL